MKTIYHKPNYYPFGWTMPERTFTGLGDYRYGFNGKENDPEWNKLHYELREYDARLGRMTSIDPRTPEYPWQSPYVYHLNSPIWQVDHLGGGGKPEDDSQTADGTFKDADGKKVEYRSGSLVEDGEVLKGSEGITVGDLKDFGYTYSSGGTYGTPSRASRAVAETVGEAEAKMNDFFHSTFGRKGLGISEWDWQGQNTPGNEYGKGNRGGAVLLGIGGVGTALYTLPVAGITLAATPAEATVGTTLLNTASFVAEIQSFWGGVANLRNAFSGESTTISPASYTSGMSTTTNFVEVSKERNVKPQNAFGAWNSGLELFMFLNTTKE